MKKETGGGASDDLKKARRSKPTAIDADRLNRLPPHSIEAEQGVLGCCLLDPAASIDEVERRGGEGLFYHLPHVTLFTRAKSLAGKSPSAAPPGGAVPPVHPLDLITLQQALKDAGELEPVGGLPYLSQLMDAVPSAANLSYYLDIVWEKWALRRVLRAAAEVEAGIWACESDVVGFLADAQQKFLTATDFATGRNLTGAKDAARDVSDNVFDTFRRGVKQMHGPATGFNFLDNVLQGLGPGFIVVGARPSTGKTALVMQIAENVAMQGHDPAAGGIGTPVGVFTLEMTTRSLWQRQTFQRAKAELRRFRNGFCTDAEIRSLTVAAGQLAALPIWLDDTSDLTIEELAPRMRRMQRQFGCKLFVVDYLQLLGSRKMAHRQSKVDEMAEVSKRLKALSKQLQVPIVVAAQLNRDYEKEPGRKPRLSDLKDCGQIEQDADVVVFLYEPKIDEEKFPGALKFLERAPVPPAWRQEHDWRRWMKRINALVAKNREGEAGVDCAMLFVRRWCRFYDAYDPDRDRQIQEEDAGGGPPEQTEIEED